MEILLALLVVVFIVVSVMWPTSPVGSDKRELEWMLFFQFFGLNKLAVKRFNNCLRMKLASHLEASKTVITVWQRQTKTKTGEFVWEHNHISDGFDEAAVTPPSTSAEQNAAWSKGTWRKLKARLVDGKVVLAK